MTLGTLTSGRSHADGDEARRIAKARKIEQLLGIHEVNEPLDVLEVGTGSGFIAHYLAMQSRARHRVQAVDVVDERQVRAGYRFETLSGTTLPFASGSFDVVISNHVIEHVGDLEMQRLHLRELRRVLRPGGVGHLAFPSRWQIVEPHYRLPFLSWLPASLRSRYVRMAGKGGRYDCRPLGPREAAVLLEDVGFAFRQRHAEALRLTYELERPHALAYRVLKHVPDAIFGAMRAAFPTLIYTITPVDVETRRRD